MVASHAAMRETPESRVLALSEHMEALAAAGDWDEVEDITVRLRRAVMEVPEARRRRVVLAVQRSIEKVAAGAKQARQTVTGKISELRRGQVAKKAYELR
ncbi:MAG: hypothetical protein OEQ90_02305 [Gammaproteobacteria bacterium]|nr:hypothetical protein [Gammaproteobacteria bacterium]